MKRDKPIICKDTGEVFWHYKSYLYGRHWAQFKRRALKFYGRRCSVCGTNKSLHVHHISYAHVGDERLHEVKILCKTCHQWEHRNKYVNVVRKNIGCSWFFWFFIGLVITLAWRYKP